MEFPNRKACIDHYEQQFPNIPRYVIEMALDYDLANEGQSTEKPDDFVYSSYSHNSPFLSVQ